MTQTTSNGLRFPEPEDHPRLWEHFKNLAVDIDPHLTMGTVQYFTSDGIWDKPEGLSYVVIEAVGGGGAGGGSRANGAGETSAGAGGSSGWYCRSVVLASSLSDTESVIIGAGGDGVDGGSGHNGEDSLFGSFVSAPGGTGGNPCNPSNSNNLFTGVRAQDNGGTGDLIVRGGPGMGQYRLPAFNTSQGGFGGNSKLGGSGGVESSDGQAGNVGRQPGGGGSGGASSGSQSARPGGDGATGIVIVWEYY